MIWKNIIAALYKETYFYIPSIPKEYDKISVYCINYFNYHVKFTYVNPSYWNNVVLMRFKPGDFPQNSVSFCRVIGNLCDRNKTHFIISINYQHLWFTFTTNCLNSMYDLLQLYFHYSSWSVLYYVSKSFIFHSFFLDLSHKDIRLVCNSCYYNSDVIRFSSWKKKAKIN